MSIARSWALLRKTLMAEREMKEGKPGSWRYRDISRWVEDVMNSYAGANVILVVKFVNASR